MLDGFSLGIARDAAAPPIVNSTVHRACHRQIPDGAVFYAAEQTGALEIAGYAQIFDGMSLPVKGAGIGAVPVRTDGRPILVIQVDIVHQNGADASVSAGKYIYQNQAASYTEITVTGEDAQHSDLPTNDEVVALVKEHIESQTDRRKNPNKEN